MNSYQKRCRERDRALEKVRELQGYIRQGAQFIGEYNFHRGCFLIKHMPTGKSFEIKPEDIHEGFI